MNKVLRIFLYVASLAVLGVLGVFMYRSVKAQNSQVDESPAVVQETEAVLPETESEILETVEVETETEEPEEDSTTLFFTGDILIGDAVISNYNSGGLSALLSDTYVEEMQNADITMVNEEFPFSTRGEAADKEYTFEADPSYVSIFQEMGIDIVTLANNHILDFGTEALLDTCDTLDAAGILYAGAGENAESAKALQIIEKNGMKFGFLAASRVWPETSWAAGTSSPGVFGTYDPTQLLAAIEEAKEQCDFLTVYVHWGVERSTTPEDYQISLATRYAEAGADLIIGAHPHVLQGASYVNGVPVFYSLGNFLFSYSSFDTAALKVVVSQDGSATYQLIPGTSSSAYTTALEGSPAIAALENISALSIDAYIDSEGYLHSETE